MFFVLQTANVTADAKNCVYPNRKEITTGEALKDAVRFDHVCGEFRKDYRNISNFLKSNVIVMDCDNDHSDDPAEWITFEKLETLFEEVSYAAAPSRNHMKEKDGRAARPKFHVYFPIEETEDAEHYAAVKRLKPTYGTVSRYGLIAYGSSLDQIGPIAKDVTDCAALLEVIASHDSKDSTSVARQEYDFTSALVDDVKGMRIGIPRDYLGEGLDKEVKEAVLAAAKVLEEKGAVVEEFDLGLVEYAIPAYYTIASAEASSNLERFDGVKYGYRTEEYEGLHNMYKKTRSEGFGEEVKRRIMLGSFVLSSGYYDAYYLKALRVKALIKQAFD